jgi:large subunit ribosomal protein L24
MKLKIKKGDFVKVLTGVKSAHTGRVLEVYPKTMRILVDGTFEYTRHTRPNQKNQQGGLVKKLMPIHYSNVMIVDSEKHPTRIGIKFEEKDGKKVPVRFARTNNGNL